MIVSKKMKSHTRGNETPYLFELKIKNEIWIKHEVWKKPSGGGTYTVFIDLGFFCEHENIKR